MHMHLHMHMHMHLHMHMHMHMLRTLVTRAAERRARFAHPRAAAQRVRFAGSARSLPPPPPRCGCSAT